MGLAARFLLGAVPVALALGPALAPLPAARATSDDCQALQEFNDDMEGWVRQGHALHGPGAAGGGSAQYSAQHAALLSRLREISGKLEDPQLREQSRALADGLKEVQDALQEYSKFAGPDEKDQGNLPDQRKQDIARRWQAFQDLAYQRVSVPISKIQQQCPAFFQGKH